MKITPEQLMAVVNLVNNPAVESASIDSHSLTRNVSISVVSDIDANQDEIDDALAVIFPTMIYEEREPFKCTPREDRTSTILYGIKVKEGIKISLHMRHTFKTKEAPAPTGAVENIISPSVYQTEEVHVNA